MKTKDVLFLVWYSSKSIFNDFVELLAMLKKAKTWSFILYATLFLMAYYRKLTWMNFWVIVILVFVIYTMRQRKEAEYNIELRERAFTKNDEEKIKSYYYKYKEQCIYTKREPLSFEEYKANELRKIEEKKYTGQE